jgi:hypothetical protein
MYDRGENLGKSPTDATTWYLKAAEQGWRDAQVSVATQYFLGRGAPRDYALAARWYERAAEQGDEGACYIIASMYENGDGVRKDLERAVYWYVQAAANGDEVARVKAREIAARIKAK